MSNLRTRRVSLAQSLRLLGWDCSVFKLVKPQGLWTSGLCVCYKVVSTWGTHILIAACFSAFAVSALMLGLSRSLGNILTSAHARCLGKFCYYRVELLERLETRCTVKAQRGPQEQTRVAKAG